MSQYLFSCIKFYKVSEGYGFDEKNKRYTVVDNEVYLRENISIDSLRWELMQKDKPTIFLINLALRLWTQNELQNRALDLTRPITNIVGRSPVKLIEKKKLRLLISLYYDFSHRQQYITALQKAELLLKITYSLRNKIRSLRAKAKKLGLNPRHQLRYDFQ